MKARALTQTNVQNGSPVQSVLIKRGQEGEPWCAQLGYEVQVLVADLIVAGYRRSRQRDVLLHLRMPYDAQCTTGWGGGVESGRVHAYACLSVGYITSKSAEGRHRLAASFWSGLLLSGRSVLLTLHDDDVSGQTSLLAFACQVLCCL